MNKWIVLLRGINVSGQKKIIMTELRAALETLGYRKVISYIQSGNLIFEAAHQAPEVIAQQVSALLMKNYGYEVEVFVVRPEWLTNIAAANPFLNHPEVESKQLYITLLSTAPSTEDVAQLERYDFHEDEYVLDNKVIYLRYAHGAGKTKLTNNFIETKLKVKATSRNWNTLLKLIALSSE